MGLADGSKPSRSDVNDISRRDGDDVWPSKLVPLAQVRQTTQPHLTAALMLMERSTSQRNSSIPQRSGVDRLQEASIAPSLSDIRPLVETLMPSPSDLAPSVDTGLHFKAAAVTLLGLILF